MRAAGSPGTREASSSPLTEAVGGPRDGIPGRIVACSRHLGANTGAQAVPPSEGNEVWRDGRRGIGLPSVMRHPSGSGHVRGIVRNRRGGSGGAVNDSDQFRRLRQVPGATESPRARRLGVTGRASQQHHSLASMTARSDQKVDAQNSSRAMSLSSSLRSRYAMAFS